MFYSILGKGVNGEGLHCRRPFHTARLLSVWRRPPRQASCLLGVLVPAERDPHGGPLRMQRAPGDPEVITICTESVITTVAFAEISSNLRVQVSRKKNSKLSLYLCTADNKNCLNSV